MSYSELREANVKAFDKLKAQYYDSSFANPLLKMTCRSILKYNVDSSEEFSEELKTTGDATKDDYGLSETYLPSGVDDKMNPVSDTFKSAGGLKIMDFACGTGLLASYLTPYLSENSEYFGVDISQDQLDVFNSKIPSMKSKNPNVNVHIHRFDIIDSNFNAENKLEKPKELVYGSFDLIFCTFSFHHLADTRKVVEQLREYLKAGGKLIVLDFYDGDKLSNDIISALHGHYNHGTRHHDGHGDHGDQKGSYSGVHHMGQSPRALKAEMESAGFSPVVSDIAFAFDMWCNKKMIDAHFPSSKVVSTLSDAPTRTKEDGTTEYLCNRPVAMCTATKC